MIMRKTQFVPSSVVWSLTADPSPFLSPVLSDWDADDESNMSGEEFVASRPISLIVPPRDGAMSPSGRPTLDEVLNNRAPPPYSLSAFMAFLSQQHCLEVLEFTLEARKYRESFEKASAHMNGKTLTTDSDEGYELQLDWSRILDVYIKPGAPREINLPSEERDDLIDFPYDPELPPPHALKPAVKKMKELMSDSIFIPFCNQFSAASHAQTFAAPFSDFGRDDRMDTSRSTFDDRGIHTQRRTANKHKSPPMTSSFDFTSPRSPPPTSHRHTQSSNLSSALGRSASSRLSTHVSNSSAASAGESALTDDSCSGDSPGLAEPMTPPTTPPSSDIGLMASHPSHAMQGIKPTRSDSGSWKKMGMKIWGKKKSGTLRERLDEM